MNNFEKVETVNKIIENAANEILAENPDTDFGEYIVFPDEYGIDRNDSETIEDIAKMLKAKIWLGIGLQDITVSNNLFGYEIWISVWV